MPLFQTSTSAFWKEKEKKNTVVLLKFPLGPCSKSKPVKTSNTNRFSFMV